MSTEIRCPKCGEVFQIDESNYESIVKQVRDHTFKEELENRLKAATDLAIARTENEYKDRLSEKEEELVRLKEELNGKLAEDEARIAALVAGQKKSEEGKANEISLAVNEAVKLKEEEISRLQSDLRIKDAEFESKVARFNSDKEKEIADLKIALEASRSESQANESNIRNQYETTIKGLKEQVDFYKDFKAKLSTKQIGESLEQWCHDEFEKIRSVAFPNAYFEKDNEVSKESGSKGDFIFRDYHEGTEITSIMFEMKNEADTTRTKHKNADFLSELNKDRNEKNCEYAVLVSMLEPESELYNQGIVNVSHRYPKMYIVRPQFFIPIISLIREGSLSSVEYKRELEIARNQDIDLTNFENNMNAFKEAFGKNYESAKARFADAINEIDKSIEHLKKIKEALTKSENQLRLANDKAEGLTVKKLTKNAPSIAEKLQGK
ncbi:MAG: DUF2130 domain-containing protein [Erysipelotrichaceae bacterium]|nr:DUF2130 domain-containing protein [Erysipelotrichaceae bacterium]